MRSLARYYDLLNTTYETPSMRSGKRYIEENTAESRENMVIMTVWQLKGPELVLLPGAGEYDGAQLYITASMKVLEEAFQSEHANLLDDVKIDVQLIFDKTLSKANYDKLQQDVVKCAKKLEETKTASEYAEYREMFIGQAERELLEARSSCQWIEESLYGIGPVECDEHEKSELLAVKRKQKGDSDDDY